MDTFSNADTIKMDTSPHKPAMVREFLDRFARAMTTGDTRAIAALWATPAFVLGDQMVKVVNSADEVEAFFAGAKDQYNQRGIADTRPEVIRLEWPSDRLVVVKVRWPYLDEHGRETGAEASTYTLQRQDDGELKVCAVMMHGELATHDKAPSQEFSPETRSAPKRKEPRSKRKN